MRSFIESLLNSTPVELTTSIIIWFIIFVFVGTALRLTANYFRQGKFRRSKYDALKDETSKLSGATLFMALFTGVAGMGTMFAVNELIKTNKLVVKSTEEAAKQTKELIKNNLLNTKIKSGEYNPIVDFTIDSEITINEDRLSVCKTNLNVIYKGNQMSRVKWSYIQMGDFYIPLHWLEKDILDLAISKYLEFSESDIYREKKIKINQIPLTLPTNTSWPLITANLIYKKEGDHIQNCGNFLRNWKSAGNSIALNLTNALHDKFVFKSEIITYKPKMTGIAKLQVWNTGDNGVNFERGNFGYIMDLRGATDSEINRSIQDKLLRLNELSIILSETSRRLIRDKNSGRYLSLDRYTFSVLQDADTDLLHKGICPQGLRGCFKILINEYDNLRKEALQTLHTTPFTLESLKTRLNKEKDNSICKELGYGDNCESLSF